MIQLWDVVTVNLDNAADKAHWEPLCRIRGVVVEINRDDDSAKVIWTEECGLTLHWGLDCLVTVRQHNAQHV